MGAAWASSIALPDTTIVCKDGSVSETQQVSRQVRWRRDNVLTEPDSNGVPGTTGSRVGARWRLSARRVLVPLYRVCSRPSHGRGTNNSNNYPQSALSVCLSCRWPDRVASRNCSGCERPNARVSVRPWLGAWTGGNRATRGVYLRSWNGSPSANPCGRGPMQACASLCHPCHTQRGRQ